MKLKNISEEDFSFEGINIPAGQTSEDLDLYVAQRLLALYYQRPLVAVEEETPAIEEEKEEEKAEEEAEEDEKEFQEGEAGPEKHECLACEKTFPTEKGLYLHNVRVHKINK